MGHGYGPGWGMMGWGGDGGYGYGPFVMIIWIIILIAIVALIVWLVRSVAAPRTHRILLPPHSSALDVLEERYARGEIKRDEYLQKKEDMGR